MTKSNYLVKINEPCHENWGNMTQNNQGKFCGSCAKNVIDFSKMSDKEIINVLEENSGNLCGRFQQKQLNRTILYENKTNNFTKFYQILSGLLFFSFAESTAETIKPRTNISPITRTSENKDSLKTPPKNDTLKGKIVAKNGEAIPGANIIIKNTALATVSNDNGTFFIFIADTLVIDTLILQIEATGYEAISLSIKRSEVSLYKEIFMNEEDDMGEVIAVLGGMMSYHPIYKPWQKSWWRGSSWRNRWNKVKNVFRRN